MNVQKINKTSECLTVLNTKGGKRKYYINSLRSTSEYIFINALEINAFNINNLRSVTVIF